MKRILRIGTRKSALAVWQAEYVKQLIESSDPDIHCEIVAMRTEGDRILDRPLYQAGGKGLFVKELDQALRDKITDISVHSLKDVPMELPDDLPILAYSRREDPRDALILRKDSDEAGMKIIGSSSRRRIIQLEQLYPGRRFTGIRGNVQTRMRKLEEGLCDGTVLAAAGLKRLGMEDAAVRFFETDEIIPAAGQGILAVQGRAGEKYGFLSCVMDERSRIAAAAERSFVCTLDGGCTAPIAAYAKISGRKLRLSGLYCCEEAGILRRGEAEGDTGEAEKLGKELALELKEG